MIVFFARIAMTQPTNIGGHNINQLLHDLDDSDDNCANALCSLIQHYSPS